MSLTVVDQGSLEMWRIRIPNYDHWLARRSPVEVRNIIVRFHTHLTCATPAVPSVVLQAAEKLDWAALNRVLEVPR